MLPRKPEWISGFPDRTIPRKGGFHVRHKGRHIQSRAEAVNGGFAGESRESLAENIVALFPDGMAPAEREAVFNESVVFMFCRGFPGCLPESAFAAFSGVDIKEAILDELRDALDGIDPDSAGGSEEADLGCAMKGIENAPDGELRRFSVCVGLPGGMEMSVRSEGCAEIMRLNGLALPYFWIGAADGPK